MPAMEPPDKLGVAEVAGWGVVLDVGVAVGVLELVDVGVLDGTLLKAALGWTTDPESRAISNCIWSCSWFAC